MLVKRAGEILFLSGLFITLSGAFFTEIFRISSIGVILILMSLFFIHRTQVHTNKNLLILFVIPVIFGIADMLRFGPTTQVQADFFLYLGFFILGAGISFYRNILGKQGRWMLYLLLGLVLIINLVSVTNYFSHREELDLLLKQSKSIPLFLGLHHIHFGIINALVLSALLLGLFDSKRISWSNVAMAMIIIGCFHILSSRTGLFSFYLSIILTGVLYAFKEKKYRILWLGTGTILLANVMAYSMSSSFRAKMENSLEDVQSWNQGEEINHKSMGMRLEAYRIAFLAAKEKPFLGHGAEEADSAMQRAYRVNHSVLEVENRIGPHNQYIEMGLKYGIPGFLYLFVFFLYWLRRGFRPLNYSILCWTLILTFSCIFESLMERQLGTIIMACSLPLIKEFGHDS